MQNLHKCKVASSSICSLYNEKEESTIHALWNFSGPGSDQQRRRTQGDHDGNLQMLVMSNFDGAIFEDLHSAGIGVVIRDGHGERIAALAEKIPIRDSGCRRCPWGDLVVPTGWRRWGRPMDFPSFCRISLSKRFNLFKNLAFIIPSLRATLRL
uniref:Uncharacterized protein n=1 Tax=Quercus lobata TaxID=97700 RepID=A0A7N2ME81_QUELO